MSYLAIFPKHGRCAPVNLGEGILHTELNEQDPFAPLDSDSGDWREKLNVNVTLPKALWFVTRDRCYSFDLRHDAGGFFISDDMLSLFGEFNITNFVRTKLHMFNGKLEPLPGKQYSYVKFYGCADVIDYGASRIDVDQKKGYIKRVWELHVKNEKLPDVFMIGQSIFYNRLFCSLAFMDAAIRNKVTAGIQFLPLKDAGVVQEWRLVPPSGGGRG
jgi:hypothetical protein